MATFQIRDDDFGLALYEADTAREAFLTSSRTTNAAKHDSSSKTCRTATRRSLGTECAIGLSGPIPEGSPGRFYIERILATARRLELAEQAAQLRAEGLLQREIADRLGVSRKYASALLVDPDGAQARARKDSYRLPCPRCGEPMSSADGLSGHPGLCWRCTAARQHEERASGH